jgi:cytochrome c biogenesis protein CcmG, thiol:disulfide interchange protein DsbE
MTVRRRRGVLVAALVAGVVAVALVVVLATRPPATASQADSPLLGQPAPSISGRGLQGGTVSLASMSGQFVLVNFFASWCGPCHEEAAQLVSLSRRISVLGVTYDDAASSAAAFLSSTGAHWPAVADGSGAIAITYGVRGPPESYLVSPDGTVVAKVLGPVTGSQVAYLDAVMARTRRAGQ